MILIPTYLIETKEGRKYAWVIEQSVFLLYEVDWIFFMRGRHEWQALLDFRRN